jgi:hypothetical protein
MLERLLDRRITTGVAILCGSLVLSGCEGHEGVRKSVSPTQRIAFDYEGITYVEGDIGKDIRGQSCLAGTPYDLDTGLLNITSSNHEMVATITPPGTDSSKFILKLVGFKDYSRPLQPYNEQSAEILSSYGCDPTGESDS